MKNIRRKRITKGRINARAQWARRDLNSGDFFGGREARKAPASAAPGRAIFPRMSAGILAENVDSSV